MMQLIKPFLVGLPITILLLAAFTGGIGNALLLLVASVICTAGIGLVVWFPVAAGVGLVALRLAGWLSTQMGDARQNASLSGGQAEPVTQAIAHSVTHTTERNNRIALDDYIRRAVRLDHNYDRILTALRSQGWTEAEIQSAYQSVTHS